MGCCEGDEEDAVVMLSVGDGDDDDSAAVTCSCNFSGLDTCRR